LAGLAQRHALEGLLLRALEELPEPESGYLEAARGPALEAVGGNLRRIAELHRVREVLESAGVPTLALKGPALAVQAYGDVSLRSYADVDVLVPRAEAGRGVRALLDAGYIDRWAKFGREPSPDHWHDWGFTAPDRTTLVEIHWSVASPLRFPSVDSEEAWKPSAQVDVDLGGNIVLALRPELLLPLLAIHATSHSWGWLEFPASVAGLLERSGSGMDWDAVLERVDRWRVRRITAVALHMAQDLFGDDVAAVPESVRRGLLEDAGAGALADWFEARLLLDPESEWYRGSPALWLRRMRMEDSVGEGLRTGWRLLLAPTPAEWDETTHGADGALPPGPARLAVRRVLRLARRYLKRS
jgi:hypothetical protein